MIREGAMLAERYEVLSRIGAGGMADVYKGKDHKLNRFVAIKVLKREFREDELFVRKFLTEAQAAAGLMHPNVVNVYDVGEFGGLYFMVMELVEGITLKEYIIKKGRLSAKEVISISIQICAGIDAAHRQHIIHRDIKPQNIIISKEGKVKVTDFGIAKATSSNTISSNAMGSVHYTSPEQARGGFSDTKSDVYSLGITMYEMVTGNVPFDGDSTVAIAIKHLQEEIVPPSEYVPDIPFSLEMIILKCTQKSADRRYPDMNALTLDLKRSLVDPEGDFVVITPLQSMASTVMITPDELERIQRQAAYEEDYDDDEDDDDEYDDDDDEYDDDEYDDDDYDDEYDDKYTKNGRGKNAKRGKNNEVNPNMAKVMKVLTVVVAVIILGIAIVTIGKASGLLKLGNNTSGTSATSTVKVPKVVGLTEVQAKDALQKKGLKVEVSTAESTEYDKGYVSTQNPSADSKVKKGSTVEIVVSSGKTSETIAIPSVTGNDEDHAVDILVNAGFENVTTEFVNDDSVESGIAVGTDPAAGTKVTKSTKITLKISKGANKPTVPSLIGKTQSEAESALSSAGLKVGSVSEEYSGDDAGKVIRQGIDSGKKVSQGTSVDIVVSKGEKPEEKATVPPVEGMTEWNASTAITNAGLEVVKNYAYDDTVQAGVVIYADPGTGTELSLGTTVTIVISKGPEHTTTPPVQEPNEPNNGGEDSGNGNEGSGSNSETGNTQ